jgi:hypothetical protein
MYRSCAVARFVIRWYSLANSIFRLSNGHKAHLCCTSVAHGMLTLSLSLTQNRPHNERQEEKGYHGDYRPRSLMLGSLGSPVATVGSAVDSIFHRLHISIVKTSKAVSKRFARTTQSSLELRENLRPLVSALPDSRFFIFHKESCVTEVIAHVRHESRTRG